MRSAQCWSDPENMARLGARVGRPSERNGVPLARTDRGLFPDRSWGMRTFFDFMRNCSTRSLLRIPRTAFDTSRVPVLSRRPLRRAADCAAAAETLSALGDEAWGDEGK